ncbi:MAG: bifunctional diaminohydroxyphosphoribosylaminopyrimidine deaminase/5-amino-6-(5-phosphoribosylamino)uracil reductase RibD [Planctomycetes bacterium]|nr:bifunctional diaminohydroxyphosphoribosylaminopyrimidine deaminase/5-amino-6-(5-phosphoribosylamino)uracil reductase RibD [Planctomycetota bacterium]
MAKPNPPANAIAAEKLTDSAAMTRALEIAAYGRGEVEPNPQVGAVLFDRQTGAFIAEGFHQRFGGPHAEILALTAAGHRARNATLCVTLEPCCHRGKTGPCTEAIIAAGIGRVVIGARDPFHHESQDGIAALTIAGIEVVTGVLRQEAERLIAPFAKLRISKIPWVQAKWAMSLDGKIASRSGHSQWISSNASRALVHELRGRMDAILIGATTAVADDPLLTARPPGPRTAMRIVIDPSARLPLDSQLVRTARDVPLLLATSQRTDTVSLARLEKLGVEVLPIPDSVESTPTAAAVPISLNLSALLLELGRRQMTNLLIEGGGTTLGAFFDADLIDEFHVFVSPKLIGSRDAISPLA